MALVRGVMAASILAGSMQLVLGSQSTKTAVARRSQMASAVAKKVLVWVMTSSPGPMPRACSVSQIASVPLPTPMAYFVPWNAANSCSNRFNTGPITYWPLSKTSLIWASISALMLWYCRVWP